MDIENDGIKQEIDMLISLLGDETSLAQPAAERALVEKIHLFLDSSRDQRTGTARNSWEHYLPYAAKRCYQLTRLEEGWDDELDYFASENAQFWLDNTGSMLETGDITGAKKALERIIEASRMMKRDRITQVEILLQAIEFALEINDKKSSVQLYDEADKLYRKYLISGTEYTGSGWLPKIKKMGRQLERFHEKLRRYFQYAETVIISMEADSESDLQRVIDYLQQSLTGQIKVTRRVKEVDEQNESSAKHFRARLKITLE